MSQPILTITHRMEFSGAHRMDNPELSQERNEEVFGVCNRVHGTTTVEASLAGRWTRRPAWSRTSST